VTLGEINQGPKVVFEEGSRREPVDDDDADAAAFRVV